MASDQDELLSEDQIERRMTDAIRRALNMPPKPHKEMVGKDKGVAKSRKSPVRRG